MLVVNVQLEASEPGGPGPSEAELGSDEGQARGESASEPAVLLDISECKTESVIGKLSTTPLAFSEVIKLFKIAATIPVSTASNERFFSVLKRVKTIWAMIDYAISC